MKIKLFGYKTGILDMWSIVHFLTGTLFGFLFLFLKFKFINALILSLLIMLFWEIYEFLEKKGESRINSISDILIGIIAFAITFYLFFDVSSVIKIYTFLFLVIVELSLFIWNIKHDPKNKIFRSVSTNRTALETVSNTVRRLRRSRLH